MPFTRPSSRRRFRDARGFTLIEVMMVVAILAAILAVGAPRLFNSSTQMRTAVREIAIMTREIRNVARLTSSTMRLVLSMDNEKGHTYWVESAPGNVTLLSSDQQKNLERLTSIQREDEKPKDEFALDGHIMKKAKRLPKGLFFESLETVAKEPITSGKAFVHFFPQGLAEDVVIHLTDRKTLNWTITVNPLTGRAEVFERKLTFKELHSP